MGLINNIRGMFGRTMVALGDGYVPARRGSLADELGTLQNTMVFFSSEYFRFMDILSWLSVYNRDVSQTVKKIVHLGNVGHSLEFSGSERACESAADELSEFARLRFPNNAGADGFINQQFRQIIVKGALCMEAAPSPGLNEISEVYLVKNNTIRFKWNRDERAYKPFQLFGVEEIPLNEETFSYIPLYADDESPYAILPFVAALRDIIRQEKQWLSIDEFTDRWGILGLVHMVFDLKRGMSESENEFRQRAESQMQKRIAAFTDKMKYGVIGTAKDTEIKHSNVSKNIGQMKEIMQSTHQGITSGLDIDPAILGYTYSTTETYAEMVYMTLVNQIQNIWRIIKRGNEFVYNRHLALRRIPVTCSMQSKTPPSLSKKDDAEAKKIDQELVLERKREGIISPDQAAMELGYDGAYNQDGSPAGSGGFNRLRFDYNRERGRYEFTRPFVSLAKKKSDDADYSRVVEIEDAYAAEFFEIYKVKYGEFLAGIEAHFSSDDVAAAIMAAMEETMGAKLPAAAKETIATWTKKSYEMGLGQKWDDDKWKVTDRAALDFFKRHDQHFFGKQFEHYSDDMRTVVEDELKGISAYTPEVKARMKEKLGDAFEHPYVKDYYDLCIRNAVNKSRNYGRTFKYERLGIAEIEVVAVLDKKTSLICRTMNGRRIEVKMLADYVRETLETPMDELTEKFAWPTEAEARDYAGMSTGDIMGKIKCKLPPYHGRCRTTTIISKKVTVKKSRGGNFSGTLSFNNKNEQAKKRGQQLKNLTRDELLGKMDSQIRTSWWDETVKEWPDGTTQSSYNYHKKKHDRFFIKNEGGFDKALKNILSNYDKVYTFGETPEWIFYRNDSAAYLHISNRGTRLTFHKYRRFIPTESMVEIK